MYEHTHFAFGAERRFPLMLPALIIALPLAEPVNIAAAQDIAPVTATEQAPEPAQPQPEKPAEPTLPVDPTGTDDSVVVTARPAPPPEDPLQSLNVQSYQAIQSIDKAVTGPVAVTYKKSIPSPIRSGLRNFLGNLQEPVVALNYLLQFKLGKSAETVGRFAINSTIGLAGVFDISKRRPINLPHRNNGFAYTLGYYGVKPGPYMYLPLIGPTTVRDLVGRIGDLWVMPLAVGRPFNEPAFAIPTTVIRLVDERAEAEDETQKLRDGPEDPYSTIRTDYLRTRQAEIDALHNRRPAESAPVPEGSVPPQEAPPAPPAQ